MRGWAMGVLVACSGGGAEDDPAILAVLDLEGDATAGEVVFGETCGAASCHAADGTGSGDAVDLTEHIPHHTDYELVSFMLYGVGSMPPMDLSDQEGADVLAYLRGTFGDHE